MIEIYKYKYLTHIIFMCLLFAKFANVLFERIQIELFIFWALPLIIFYFYINKLTVKAYQWFCFVLIIYFLSSSLRVFGTDSYWLDITELLLISILFIHIMFGPKVINKAK